MANPRQRRKARSSAHKSVTHSRHAKRNLKKTPPIRGPKALQDAWNNKKTVRQNYIALGLIHSLNPSATGGVEPTNDSPIDVQENSSVSSTSIPNGYGKIIRDELGNVMSIELANDENDDLELTREVDTDEMVTEIDANIAQKWVHNLGNQKPQQVDRNQKSLVDDLQALSAACFQKTTLSAAISGVGPRHASTGETSYLQKLVDKYGTDVERMARDRKLNFEQRTGGELRRALTRANLN